MGQKKKKRVVGKLRSCMTSRKLVQCLKLEQQHHSTLLTDLQQDP